MIAGKAKTRPRPARGVVQTAFALMVVSACASCGNDANRDRGTHQEIRIALPADVSSLDPNLATSSRDSNVLVNVFDGLYRIDQDGKIVPDLATNMSKSADGLTYTFTLRDDVNFQNGEKFTAEDVKFSLDRLLDPKNAAPYAADLQAVESVAVNSEYEVALHLKSPDPILTNELAGQATMIVPKDYVTKIGKDEFARQPVGTGPFKLASRRPSEEIVLQRWDDYWGSQKPSLETITYTISPEPATRAALLQSGEVDMANNLDASARETLKNTDVKVIGVPTGGVQFLALREEEPRFRNPLVAQAMNYAINRQQIVKEVLDDYGQPLGAIFPPGLFGYESALPAPYPYDPAKARQLLAQTGEDFTQPIEFAVPSERWLNINQAAQAIVSDLAKVGITLELKLMDYSAWLKDNKEHTISPVFPDDLTARVRDMIPGYRGSLECGASWSFYCDKDLDALIEQAATQEEGQRVQAITRVTQYIHEHPHWVFLWSTENVFGINTRVNWKPIPASEFMDLRHASVGVD